MNILCNFTLPKILKNTWRLTVFLITYRVEKEEILNVLTSYKFLQIFLPTFIYHSPADQNLFQNSVT